MFLFSFFFILSDKIPKNKALLNENIYNFLYPSSNEKDKFKINSSIFNVVDFMQVL